MLQHPIVGALCRERHTVPHGTTTVGPAAGDKTLWVLRHGNGHRGATWFDPEEQVVWLCAYGPHRSGTPSDAFQHFAALLGAGTMRPTAADLQALAEDHAERYVVVVEDEARELLAAARAALGIEQRRVIGLTQPVGLVVHVVETLEETFVAVYADARHLPQFQLLLAALYPD
jgi:hypothetical protein